MSNPWGLSERESQVMDAILVHGCHKLVARSLGIEKETVSTYAERARRKMGATGHRLRYILQWHDFRSDRAAAHLEAA